MTPRQARLGADLFTGAVVVSVAFALAGLTWRMTGEPGVGPAAAPVTAQAAATDIQPLIALAPFGTAMASAEQAAGNGVVTLQAIFLAVPMEASVVLLATADGQVASYGVGAAVGGGVIETIEAERIVLRTSGGLQTIGFNPEAEAAAATAATGTPAVATPAVATATATATTSGTGLAGLPSANTTPRPANAPASRPTPVPAGVDAMRSLIPPSAQGRAAAAPPAPAAARSPAGFRIGASPSPVLTNAGIRPGDVIQRVNGNPVNSGTSEAQLMAQSMRSGSAQVELLRDGELVSLTVSVR